MSNSPMARLRKIEEKVVPPSDEVVELVCRYEGDTTDANDPSLWLRTETAARDAKGRRLVIVTPRSENPLGEGDAEALSAEQSSTTLMTPEVNEDE